MPAWISFKPSHAWGINPCRSASGRAVSQARCSGLAITASSATPSNAEATAAACFRPSSDSAMSVWPWILAFAL
ncbi:MAG: hypothetical protein QM811_05080 [Pirellulales bacterium]